MNQTYKCVKMTSFQGINFTIQTNLSTFNFWLELAWLGSKCKGKTLLIFFALRRDSTETA